MEEIELITDFGFSDKLKNMTQLNGLERVLFADSILHVRTKFEPIELW